MIICNVDNNAIPFTHNYNVYMYNINTKVHKYTTLSPFFPCVILFILYSRGRPLHYMYPNRKCTPKTLC